MKNSEYIFPVQASILSENAIKSFLEKNYNIGNNLKCWLYSKSMNDTYFVKGSNKNYYLKVSHNSRQDYKQIDDEIRVVTYLKEQGLNVVTPVKNNKDEYINIINAPEGERHIVLYEELEGKNYFDNSATLLMNRNLGREISKIYKALDEYDFNSDALMDDSMISDFILPEINKSPFVSKKDIEYINSTAQGVIEKVNTLLPKTKPEYGIIHGDFCPGHAIFNKDEEPFLFDFEFIGKGWRAYDLSIYLTRSSTWRSSQDKMKERMERRDSFFEGFNEIRALTDNEINALNTFVPFHRIWVLGVSLSRSFVKGMSISKYLIEREIDLIKEWIDYYKIL